MVSAVLTHGRAPRLRASLGPSISPPPKMYHGSQLLVGPCFWWALLLVDARLPLVSRMDNAPVLLLILLKQRNIYFARRDVITLVRFYLIIIILLYTFSHSSLHCVLYIFKCVTKIYLAYVSWKYFCLNQMTFSCWIVKHSFNGDLVN